MIFFDIDGTLLSRGQIPVSALKAIKLLKKNGWKIAAATGRQYFTAKPVMEQAGISEAVCDGGHTIISSNSIISCKPLDHRITDPLFDELLEKKIPFAVMPDTEVRELVSSSKMMAGREKKDFEFVPVRIDDSFDPYKADCMKVCFQMYEGEEDRLESVDARMLQRFCSDSLFYEPDDKSEGIIRLLEYHHLTIEDAVIFGDGLNDIKMFQTIPFSIAMGNADEQLKRIAHYVTDSAGNHGIFRACEHFGWIEGDGSMYEYSKKEQQRISELEQIDRYLIDPRDHVLRAIDGRPVMKESTVPVMIALMLAGCLISIGIGVFRTSTQRILMMGAAAFFAFYAVRYYQYLRALKGK